MKRSFLERVSWTLVLLLPALPATAQHPAARHPAAAPSHMNTHPSSMPAQPHITPQQQKQMQQQQHLMQQEMQKQMQMEMKHQEMMIQQMQKNHQAHMKQFNEWTQKMNAAGGAHAQNANASTANGKGTQKAAGAEDLPTFTSHQHFQKWLAEQKHRKATKKSYHLGYDRYLAYYGHLQNLRTLVNHLHSARQLLAPLKADYEGHRVMAMEHIGQAINSLYDSAIGPRPAMLGTGGSSGNLSQADSDARMRRALGQLQSADSRLALTAGLPGHIQARQYVEGAMQELNTALAVH